MDMGHLMLVSRHPNAHKSQESETICVIKVS